MLFFFPSLCLYLSLLLTASTCLLHGVFLCVICSSLLNDSFDSLFHPLFLIDVRPLDARLPPRRRITLSLLHGDPLPRATAQPGSFDDRAQGSNRRICRGEERLLMFASQRGAPAQDSLTAPPAAIISLQ